MKDIKGTEIKEGDLLLNLENERSPFDAWSLLICVTDSSNGQVIRDLNAWNCGWDPAETFNLGSYKNWKSLMYAKDYERLDITFKVNDI